MGQGVGENGEAVGRAAFPNESEDPELPATAKALLVLAEAAESLERLLASQKLRGSERASRPPR